MSAGCDRDTNQINSTDRAAGTATKVDVNRANRAGSTCPYGMWKLSHVEGACFPKTSPFFAWRNYWCAVPMRPGKGICRRVCGPGGRWVADGATWIGATQRPGVGRATPYKCLAEKAR